MRALDLGLAAPALLVLVPSGYLFALALLSARTRPPSYPAPRLKFDLLVPAHNEEAGIAKTVRNLLGLDYPAALRRVWVIADNCQDQTAREAERAGATVLIRNEPERRGKGYALELAFERLLADGIADAAVVIDADTVAAPNLLQAFSARLEAGAGAVQAEYGVLNPLASWRTRLMTIAFALFHGVRSAARERLGLSCGLRGNGMCFSREVIRKVPHQAFSIVEDLEYGIRLGEAGYRVSYAGEASVLGEMVASERASRSQRRRWEGGRLAMAKLHAPRLLMLGLSKRNPVLFDLAIDLLVPPLSYLVLASALGSTAVFVLTARGVALPASALLWPSGLFFLSAYVARGWWISGMGLRGLFDLLLAPLYIFWKLALLLRRPAHSQGEWVRTAREGEHPSAAQQK